MHLYMSHTADINLFDDENFPATSGMCLEKVHPSLLRITFTNFKQYTYERGGWVTFGFLISSNRLGRCVHGCQHC